MAGSRTAAGIARAFLPAALQRNRRLPPSAESLANLRGFASDPGDPPLLGYEETPDPSCRDPSVAETPRRPPQHTAVLLHGLLGSGRNWRNWTRRLASALDLAAAAESPAFAPGTPSPSPSSPSAGRWRFVLVDLRSHGSSSSLRLPGPASIQSAAEDVLRLVQASPWLPATHGGPQQAAAAPGAAVVIGHSVGGKVALEYTRQALLRKCVSPPQQVWVLDSVPGSLVTKGGTGAAPGAPQEEAPAGVQEESGGDDVSQVLNMLRSLPRPVNSRRWLVEEVQRRGFSQGLAEWLGSSLKNLSKDAMDFQFDLPGAIALYSSYRSTDLFPFVEAGPPAGTELRFVRAERSDRWSPGVLRRLEAAARDSAGVKVDVLPKAGHWLHVDNPDGLIDLMASGMSTVA